MASNKMIAIIGAGPLGLVALKTFLEHGFDATTYEQQSSIGGLWSYQEDDDKYYASIPTDPHQYLGGCYYSLIQNTSKVMTQFSDFPAPLTMPSVMRHFEFLHYLREYAKHFNLNEHIKLNSTVVELRRGTSTTASARDSRPWEVHYQSEGRYEAALYDLVVVASGNYNKPFMPAYPGADSFIGDVLHSVQVRRDDLFRSKRVIIAGGGFSGAEMVRNALNGHAQSIYWVISSAVENTDHNHWVFGLFPDKSEPNKPWDQNIIRQGYPEDLFGENGKLKTWLYPLNQCKSHPDLRIPGDGLAITDLPLVKRGMESGQVCLVKSAINSFAGSSVLLSDGTKLDDINIVVFSTGYTKAFPFLNSLWNKKKQVEAALYRHVLPVEDQLQGIAFVGVPYKLTSFFPTAEMQSRWLAKFWAARGSMYDQQELDQFKAEIQKRKDSLVYGEKYSFLADSISYVEELAEELGCRPPVEKLLQSDKVLGLALMYGPLISAQYRLVGEYTWPEAREYIIKTAIEVCGEEKWQQLLEGS